jgi:VWFA-related protein
MRIKNNQTGPGHHNGSGDDAHYTMRNRGFTSVCILFIVIAIILAAGSSAIRSSASLQAARNPQGAQAQVQQSQQPIRVEVSLVNLFATVRDKHSKQIISTLEQGDFNVSEDGVAQKISFFSKDSKLPVTLGLLVDTSGSEQNTLGAEQEAAARFLSRIMRKGDLTAVFSFDTDTDLLADFTDDVGVLDRAVRRTRINAPSGQGPLAQQGPGTVFYDAVYLACHDKLAGEAGRKALIILTDAQDEGSQLRVQDAIEVAQRTDTVVHILLIGDPYHFSVNESVAKKITDETGGRTIVVRNEKNLEQAFDQISEELRSQYTIGYTSTNPARDGAYRKIKVETNRKELDVLTRRGYYAPKS